MINCDEMSDFEISKLLSDIVLLKNWYCKPENLDGLSWAYGENFGLHNEEREMLDINKPADMWPIILDNKISLKWYEAEDGGDYKSWYASSADNECHDKNPLRASAIVFLMMKDAEK